MASDSFKIKKSLNLEPTAVAPTEKGDLTVNTSGNIQSHDGTTVREVTTNTATQTLTNKTLSTSQNTISSTASRAAIFDGTGKLNPSSVTTTELNYVSGVTSDIQTQLNGKQASGNYVTDLTGDVSASGPGSAAATVNSVGGSSAANIASAEALANAATDANTASAIVKRDASGNFSAGTITAALSGNATTATTATNVSGTVAIANGGTGQTSKAAAFDALSPTTTKGDVIVHNGTNNIRLGVGSFGQALTADSSQTSGLAWTTIPQGLKNYITTNAGIEQGNTTGYSLGNVSLTNGLPTGVPTFGSGASGNLSLSAVSSGQLAGNYSLSYASSAATTAGDFVATDAFSVDLEGQAKVMQFKLYYKASVNPSNGNFSGTSSNSFGVAVYDVTNSAWIIPAGVFNFVQSSGVGLASGTFQTSSDGTSYRLVVYNANASAGSITMLFDDFFIGPQIIPQGAAISDWQSYSATLTGLGAGSATVTALYRDVGDSIEIVAYALKDGTPGSGASPVTLSLPSGKNIEFNKSSSSAGNRNNLGTAESIGLSGLTNNTVNMVSAVSGSLTSVAVFKSGSNNYVTGADMLAASELIYHFTVPISGKSSNTVMSNDTDTRVVDLVAYKSSGSTTLNTTIASWTTEKDSHGAFNSSTGTYTIPVSGDYDVSFFFQTTSTSGTPKILKNGSAIATGTGSGATSGVTSIIPNCVAGDTITVQQDVSVTVSSNTTGTRLSIKRLSGPATIAASSVVAAQYNLAGAVASSTSQPVNFATKIYDTHSAVTTGSSWKFTAPCTGYYRVTTNLASATSGSSMSVYKNGSSAVQIGDVGSAAIATQAGTIKLNAGDYIDVRFISSLNTNAGTGQNISIESIGGIL